MKNLKKLVFTFALLLTVSFAFAGNEVEKASVVEVEESLELNSSIKAEASLFTRYIRWCHYHNGVRYCTKWTELLDEVEL